MSLNLPHNPLQPNPVGAALARPSELGLGESEFNVVVDEQDSIVHSQEFFEAPEDIEEYNEEGE